MTKYTESDMTPWFPADVKPERIGYYQRDYYCEETEVPDYWDGETFHICIRGGTKIAEALNDMPWRGLRFDPSAEAK